ncbi:hypothetical protein R1flu_001878 [Riccia fluitans]|uniref:Uncharacterized protein n=1 Tax=Riccia fluitans TaxID=41844 RepID=A0ABD1Y4I6_9MARC
MLKLRSFVTRAACNITRLGKLSVSLGCTPLHRRLLPLTNLRCAGEFTGSFSDSVRGWNSVSSSVTSARRASAELVSSRSDPLDLNNVTVLSSEQFSKWEQRSKHREGVTQDFYSVPRRRPGRQDKLTPREMHLLQDQSKLLMKIFRRFGAIKRTISRRHGCTINQLQDSRQLNYHHDQVNWRKSANDSWERSSAPVPSAADVNAYVRQLRTVAMFSRRVRRTTGEI